jgi:hypothetical protein
MVHALAVPQHEDRSLARILAVARGDGCIAMYDADHKPGPASSGSSGRGGRTKQRAAAGRRSAAAAASAAPGRLALLGPEQGGHTAAVNCVSFAAGSDARQLLSAGNDRRLLLWNWQVAQAAAEEARPQAADALDAASAGDDAQPDVAAEAPVGCSGQQLLAAEHLHSHKINWACSADVPGCPYNVFLASTGRRIAAVRLQ